MITPLYIFDLDGTLALADHRRHFVRWPHEDCYDCHGKNFKNCVQCADLDGDFKPDWRGFFAACVDDEPNKDVIRLMHALIDDGNDVWIWSGRSDEVRQETIEWLSSWTQFFGQRVIELKMRVAGDHQNDDRLKAAWYMEMNEHDRKRLVMAFDDRDRMVKMWRDLGVTCLQVAPGDF